jgi:hypothetical protein
LRNFQKNQKIIKSQNYKSQKSFQIKSNKNKALNIKINESEHKNEFFQIFEL